MREPPRQILRKIAFSQLAFSPVLLIIYICLAIAGVIHWYGLLFDLIPLTSGAVLYGASRIPIPSKTKAIEPKMEPFTRTPDHNQCPVCGITDLDDYRYKDGFLALTGDEKYVQKWGAHDAHWSCIIACPYEPTREEINEKAHKGGKHDSVACDDCDLCLRTIEREQVIRDDQVNAIPGCYCAKCVQKTYSTSVQSMYYRYGIGHNDFETLYHHYELMMRDSEPGSVRRAYAVEMMERVKDK